MGQLAWEFLVDDHSSWEEPDSPKMAMERRKKWQDQRDQAQTALQMGGEQGQEEQDHR